MPLTAIDGVGAVTIVIVLEAVDVQPLVVSVTVTVYNVVAVGFTVIAAVVAPVLQAYVPPPLAVKVALPPLNTLSSFIVQEASVSEIAAVGGVVLEVTATDAVAEQPPGLVTVTV